MANIAETRAQMDHTIDELSERLQPRHIIDDVLDYFRSRRRDSSGQGRKRVRRVAGKAADHVKDAAGQVKEKAGYAGRAAYSQVRQHPLPALLIGAGISMLLMERNREDRYEDYDGSGDLSEFEHPELGFAEGASPESYALPQHYTADSGGSGTVDKLKEKGAQLREKGSELKRKASSSMQNIKERTAERASALRARASEKGGQLKEKAYHGYEYSRDTFSRAADEQPLAIGLGFLAVGLIAGILLPSTRKEDEFVGPARDRLVNRTREVAEDAVNRGKHVAQTAVETAKQQAREQELTPESLKEKAQTMASQVTEATRQDAQRQKQEFTDQVKSS